MKKIFYIKPECDIVCVRLTAGVLDTNAGFNNNASTAGSMEGTPAKESLEIENEDVLPTQKNLWDDDEE